MEANTQTTEVKYNYCEHLKNQFFNIFSSTILQFQENKNFFYLNKIKEKNTFNSLQIKNILDNYFIKNISNNWTAVYNPQSLSSNSTNKDGCIFTITFDSLGQYLASSNHNHNIEIWDFKEKKFKKIITDHKEIVTGIEYFNNNNDFMMSCSLDKTIKLWNNYEHVYTFHEHSDWVRCLALSKNNKHFLSGCVSSVIKYWDIQERKVIHSINNVNNDPELLNTVNSLTFLNNNENVFLSGLRSGVVKLYDVRKNNYIIREFKAHKSKLNSVKINHNDKYLLSSGRDSLIKLWDFRMLPVYFIYVGF